MPNDWIANLADVDETRSNTSVCLKIVDSQVAALDEDGQANFAKGLVGLLEKEGVAYDVGHYRDAPSGCASGQVRRSKPPTCRS